MNTKVRLVICPRCRQVLPELANLPVYKCGGCGVVLHAKNQANDIRDQGLCSKETDTDQKIDLGQFSEDRDESFANQQVVHSTGLSISEKSSGRSKNEFEDYMEEPGHGKLSDEVLTSTALACHKNEEPLPEAMENMKLDKEQSPLGHCNGRDQDENKDCHMKRSSVNFSFEVSSLRKLGHHENESLTGAEAKREHDESTCSLQRNAKIDQIELKNYNDKYVGNVNMSNEASSSARLPFNELEEPSVEAEDDTDVYGIFKSSSTENFIAARSRNSVITAQGPLGESIFAENLPSPDSRQLEKTTRSMVWGLDCASPEETLDNITLLNPNSHLNDTGDEMSNSPDTKSYYACRGNASCYDETSECISQGHLHPSRRNFSGAYSFNKKGLQRQGEFTGNMMASDSQMQYQTITSSSILQGNKHRVMKGKWPFDELMEPVGHSHSARSKMRSEKKEHLSRLPFYSMSCQGEYGHDGRPLNYGKNEFQYYSPLYSPDMCTKPDKMELLRMVYDLQDQLNRTHISKEEVSGMLPTRDVEKERQTSLHNHRLASKEEIYTDLSCPTHFGECVQDQKWPQHRKISKRASSCETTYTRCHCPCLDRSSQGRNHSAQLPSHAFHYNVGHHMANKRHYSSNLHNFGHPNCSSPPHYTSSEFSLWTCDTNSEDHGHEDHEMKKIHLRRKQHFMKSHIRPQAGGAPVVSCYHCSELLQFPADFLLFRKRLHRLRCGACSEVLKFSLESRIHLVPYFSDAAIHQPKKDTEHKSLSNSTY